MIHLASLSSFLGTTFGLIITHCIVFVCGWVFMPKLSRWFSRRAS